MVLETFFSWKCTGLISGLTGEGIYQALVSGEEVAKIILNENHEPHKINGSPKNKKKQEKIMNILIKSGKFRNFIYYFEVFY